MKSEIHHKVFSKEVIEFVTVANEFCLLLENSGEINTKEFLYKLQRMMPLLYLRSLLLPSCEPLLDQVNEKFVTESDWHILSQNLAEKFGDFDSFMELNDDVNNPNDIPVRSSISEMIADIYQDLKDFLMLYRMGEEMVMNDALWECMQNYDEFWGQKLVNSIRVVHVVSKKISENQDEDEKEF